MLDSRNDLWAVVLAGGEGDSQTLLRHTVERVTRLIPPARTLAVTQASHAAHVAGELVGHPAIRVLAQPCDRGSAAGVLLAAHWIQTRAPGAAVAVFPTNHFMIEEEHFMSHVAEAGAYVRTHPRWLLLLGVPPTEPAPAHGWIEPGEPVGSTGRRAVHRVRAFHDEPPTGRGLCNTLVFTATVAALVEAGRACLPLLHDRLTRFDLFTGTRYEAIALQQAYLFAPTADFSRAVLASADVPLAVVEVPALTWWDVGTPERVARSVGMGSPRE